MKPFCERLEDLIIQREVEVMKADADVVTMWIDWAKTTGARDMEWSSRVKKDVVDVLWAIREDILEAIESRKEDRCCSPTT